LVALFIVAAAAVPASAGNFTRYLSCSESVGDSVQYAVHFGIYDFHDFGPCNGIRIESYSNAGSPYSPILALFVPPGFHAEIDSLTGVTIRPDTVITRYSWFYDGFTLITTTPGACFWDTYLEPGDVPRYHDVMCVPCADPTPTHPATWGALKATYR